MIDFEPTEEQKSAIRRAHQIAEEMFRPVSRYYDENEHENPKEIIEALWSRKHEGTLFGGLDITGILTVEEVCWGDVGFYLVAPGPCLGGAAVFAAGTNEQIEGLDLPL